MNSGRHPTVTITKTNILQTQDIVMVNDKKQEYLYSLKEM
jgi:hypothetical protein